MLKKYEFAKYVTDAKYLGKSEAEEYKVNNHEVNKAVFFILFSRMSQGYKRNLRYSSLFETDEGYKSTTDLQTYERIEE